MSNTKAVNITAHELTLFIINTSAFYDLACEIAKNDEHPRSDCGQAQEFVLLAYKGAMAYEKEFGTTHFGASDIFTVFDLLDCASELAEYYISHVVKSGLVEESPAENRLQQFIATHKVG